MGLLVYRGVALESYARPLHQSNTPCHAAHCWYGQDEGYELVRAHPGGFSFCPKHYQQVEDWDKTFVSTTITTTTAGTSAAAVTSNANKAESQRQRILTAITDSGSRGMTDDEIQKYLQLDGNTQRPRRRELDIAGKIVTKGKRANSRGNICTVWVAV